ncbi:MAG: metallophosphoesterase [Proteobacteria bacterium]|uniref:Metallophosphoesterase n=1 Tax=Candidatus Avisuccinivibrio stercorigallinarum TaxID=2840704 RepID=A0A9D9GPG7_9GAMM|nr:metallophosphoesterase [Candidatus Avisuccinivibrio stercorigallinarum]
MNYFTADPHFGHGNIIKYCNRPFADAAEMDAVLTANWNSRVQPEDDIYILGDFCMSSSPAKAEAYLLSLNGRKHLIRGNHDTFLKKHPERFAGLLCEICDYKELHLPSGRTYILMHYPLLFWNGSADPNVVQLYGHIHNNEYCNALTGRMLRSLNVGVDLHGFAPLSEDQVWALVQERSARLQDSPLLIIDEQKGFDGQAR